MDRVLGRIEAALDRIEAALVAGARRDEARREGSARLRGAVGGAIARIDGLLERLDSPMHGESAR